MARGFLSEDHDDDDYTREDEIDARKTVEIAGAIGNAARGGFFFDAGDKRVFVPFGVVIVTSPHSVTVPEWWARKEGLI